jgi:hypothetical protein
MGNSIFKMLYLSLGCLKFSQTKSYTYFYFKQFTFIQSMHDHITVVDTEENDISKN